MKAQQNERGYGYMNIGEKICALRKERGMTQEMLAEQLVISAQAISKWERGVSHK